MKKTVMLFVLVLAVVGGVAWSKGYYESRYVGSDYYALVPATFDTTPEDLYDAEGVVQAMGKDYDLTAYSSTGEAKAVSFEIVGDRSGDFLQPGTYLRISASSQIVLGQEAVSKDDVPAAALARIEAAN